MEPLHILASVLGIAATVTTALWVLMRFQRKADTANMERLIRAETETLDKIDHRTELMADVIKENTEAVNELVRLIPPLTDYVQQTYRLLSGRNPEPHIPNNKG